VRFMRLDDASRAVIDRALAWKEQQQAAMARPAEYTRSRPPPSTDGPRSSEDSATSPRRNGEPPAADGAELEHLAAEWGITPERIEATIARVRAERPSTDERE